MGNIDHVHQCTCIYIVYIALSACLATRQLVVLCVMLCCSAFYSRNMQKYVYICALRAVCITCPDGPSFQSTSAPCCYSLDYSNQQPGLNMKMGCWIVISGCWLLQMAGHLAHDYSNIRHIHASATFKLQLQLKLYFVAHHLVSMMTRSMTCTCKRDAKGPNDDD
jgi:hypothetical protein